MTPFRRDGHLSDLGLERLLAGEVERELAEPHLATCPTCAARLAQLEAPLPLPQLRAGSRASRTPPARSSPPEPLFSLPAPPAAGASPEAVEAGEGRSAGAGGRWWLVGGLAAAAAALLVVLGGRSEDPQGWRARGAGPTLEVYVARGEGAARLRDGDAVRPGDRLGFRLRDPEGGHVLVVGVDATGAVYPCWPPDGRSRPLPPSLQPTQLDAAVAVDATPGDERIVAIRCAAPIGLTDVAPAGPPAPAGCSVSELRLVKEVR